MPKTKLLPPKGARPVAELPAFALAKVNGGHLDGVIRWLYATVREAGGQPNGIKRGHYQFTLWSVNASVKLSTGCVSAWTFGAINQRVRRSRRLAVALPTPDLGPLEPHLYVDPQLHHGGFAWTIDFPPETGDRRIYEMNAAIGIFRQLGQRYRQAVVQILKDGVVDLYVRMDATSGFMPVYPDAVPNCCLDWAGLRLELSDGRKPEQAMFTPASRRAERSAGDGPAQKSDLELCGRIGQAILAAFPDRVWKASDVIELMREFAPSVGDGDCRRIFAELKQTLPDKSPWRTGGRPPAQSLRALAEPILQREGLISSADEELPDDGGDAWR